jgi:hypothetical protein
MFPARAVSSRTAARAEGGGRGTNIRFRTFRQMDLGWTIIAMR